MHRLTESEREHYDRWLRHLADGDPRLLALLEVSLGRIAAGNLRRVLDARGPGSTMKLGDLPTSKMWAEDIPVVIDWLQSALEQDADWLRDVDGDGVPKRLAACADYEDLLDESYKDSGGRPPLGDPV